MSTTPDENADLPSVLKRPDKVHAALAGLDSKEREARLSVLRKRVDEFVAAKAAMADATAAYKEKLAALKADLPVQPLPGPGNAILVNGTQYRVILLASAGVQEIQWENIARAAFAGRNDELQRAIDNNTGMGQEFVAVRIMPIRNKGADVPTARGAV